MPIATVKVQWDTRKCISKSIFPYDGTDRIRFAGQGKEALSQPVCTGTPKTKLQCAVFIIIPPHILSRKIICRTQFKKCVILSGAAVSSAVEES